MAAVPRIQISAPATDNRRKRLHYYNPNPRFNPLSLNYFKHFHWHRLFRSTAYIIRIHWMSRFFVDLDDLLDEPRWPEELPEDQRKFKKYLSKHPLHRSEVEWAETIIIKDQQQMWPPTGAITQQYRMQKDEKDILRCHHGRLNNTDLSRDATRL